MQALAEGDLSERARRRAAELACDADLRLNPPQNKANTTTPPPQDVPIPASVDQRLPPPGTILTRPYKGQLVQVHVLTDGFAYAGRVYASLSAVAKAITSKGRSLMMRNCPGTPDRAGKPPARVSQTNGVVTRKLRTSMTPSRAETPRTLSPAQPRERSPRSPNDGVWRKFGGWVRISSRTAWKRGGRRRQGP